MKEETAEETEITKQKFIGMFLWLIGYFLALIFGECRMMALISLIVFACSLGENLILKSSKGG